MAKPLPFFSFGVGRTCNKTIVLSLIHAEWPGLYLRLLEMEHSWTSFVGTISSTRRSPRPCAMIGSLGPPGCADWASPGRKECSSLKADPPEVSLPASSPRDHRSGCGDDWKRWQRSSAKQRKHFVLD